MLPHMIVLAALLHPGATRADETTNAISIAAAAPLSGRFANRGRSVTIGAKMAADDINAGGGVQIGAKRHKLNLIIEDDKCGAQTATTIAQKFALRGIALVVGHACTRSSIAAAKLYASSNILQIEPFVRHADFTDKRAGPSVFRLAGRHDRQGAIAGTYLAASYPNARIAVVHDRTLASIAVADAVVGALKKWRHKGIIAQTMRPGEKDYSKLVARLTKSKADIIYIASYATETGILTRQLSESGNRAKIMSTQLIQASSYIGQAGATGRQALLTLPPRPEDFVSARQLIARLRAANVPDLMSALSAYAAVQIWSQGAQAAGTVHAQQIAVKLNTISFETVLGTITFNQSGDSNLPSYRVYRRGGAASEPLARETGLTRLQQ